MADPIRLQGRTPEVDSRKVGISYAGGGPLVVVELGVARAFVRKGIVPDAIAGASAGALAGFAHALDVRAGTGIALGAELLGRVSNQFLGLDPFHVLGRLLVERERLLSLGDNAVIGPLVGEGLARVMGLDGVTTRTFVPPTYPKLLIVATDIRRGGAVWFSDDTPAEAVPIEEALIASSATPGVFPWRVERLGGADVLLADGGVVDNQPLSKLVEQGCGTLYACAVGPTAWTTPSAPSTWRCTRAPSWRRTTSA